MNYEPHLHLCVLSAGRGDLQPLKSVVSTLLYKYKYTYFEIMKAFEAVGLKPDDFENYMIELNCED